MQKYKPYKKSLDYSYSIGISPTIELLHTHPSRVQHVFLAPESEHSSGIQKIRELCLAHRIPVEVNARTITRLLRSDNCYALGVFHKYEQLLDPTTPHVVLIHPDDAGNTGTILRTMLGFNHNDLAIIKPGIDIFDPKTIRASMGSVFKQRIEYFATIEAYKQKFDHHLYPFILATKTLLHDVDFKGKYSLIFGNEGSGLPSSYATLGTPVRIEQTDDIDSLNVAVAASIALYGAFIKNRVR